MNIHNIIRNWYIEAYPSDELGKEIKLVSFSRLYEALKSGEDVYEVLGVSDSLVRERVFERLADILGVEYDKIYRLWLDEGEKKKITAYLVICERTDLIGNGAALYKRIDIMARIKRLGFDDVKAITAPTLKLEDITREVVKAGFIQHYDNGSPAKHDPIVFFANRSKLASIESDALILKIIDKLETKEQKCK